MVDRLIAGGEQNWQDVHLSKNATLFWAHHITSDQELVEFLNSGSDKITPRYPNIEHIADKDSFGQAMNFAAWQDPEAFHFVPPTFELGKGEDAARFAEY